MFLVGVCIYCHVAVACCCFCVDGIGRQANKPNSVYHDIVCDALWCICWKMEIMLKSMNLLAMCANDANGSGDGNGNNDDNAPAAVAAVAAVVIIRCRLILT